MLHPTVVQMLFLQWGQLYMDLFTSEENHQLPLFFSRAPHRPAVESICGDTKHLFLRTTSPYGRAKQGTIAGWVKKTIKMVYTSAKPSDLRFMKLKSHDTRALAAT